MVNRAFRVKVNRPQKAREEKPKRYPTLHYTMESPPEFLAILLISEYKSKDYVQQVFADAGVQECVNEYGLSEHASIITESMRTYTQSTLSNMTMDEQCKLADLCQMYDDKLDSVLTELEKSVSGHIHHHSHIAEDKRGAFAKLYAAGYACMTTTILHESIKENMPFMVFLRKKMVDGMEFKHAAERIDNMLAKIVNDEEISFGDSQLYNSLNAKYQKIIADPVFLVEAGVSCGYDFSLPTEADIAHHHELLAKIKQIQSNNL